MALTKISTAMISQSAAAVDLNVDAGTFYVDTTNNRVGVGGKTDPDTPLHVVGTATATLFAGSGASLTSIPNSALVNSSITINSTAVSLGGSITLGTDDLSEGSSNLYYTDARVDARVSGGSLGNITTTGYIRGPATFTLDPAAHGDDTGTVVIAGNLQVDGTTTTINSTTLTVDDKNITLASGSANAAAADGAGFTVDIGTGTNPAITYDGTNDEWDFNKPLNVTGTAAADAFTFDNYTLDSNKISTNQASGYNGDIFLDAAGDIILDAAGNDVILKDNGTTFGQLTNDSGNLVIYNSGSQMLKGLSTGPNAEFIGTVKIPKLGINASANSNYSLYALQNGSITHAAYLQVNGGTATGLEINASASSAYSGDVLYARQSSRNTGGNLARFANSDGDKFVVKTDGNVGIGTSSPASNLHIKIATAGTPASTVAAGTSAGIYLEDDQTPTDNYFVSKVHNPGNDTAIGGIKFAVSPDGGNYSWAGIKGLTSSSGNAGNLAFYTSAGNTSGDSSTERMRIDSSGDVGIGVVPATHARLTIGGTATSYSSSLVFDNNTAGGAEFFMLASDNTWSAGANKFLMGHGSPSSSAVDIAIDADGKVGIGTYSPAAPLHIQFSNNDGGVGGQLIKNTNTGTTSNYASLSTQAVNGTIQGTFGSAHYSTWGGAVTFAGSQTSHPFKILTGNAVRATFDTAGNVGIGTDTPEGKLHVEVLGSNATPPIKINRGLDGGRIQLQYSSNETGYGEIGQMYAGTGRTQIWIGANLNSFSTGHNSSPLQHDANYASWFSDWDSYRDRFTIGRIASGTTSRLMTINSSGKVGIGTDNPSRLLTVQSTGQTDLTIRSGDSAYSQLMFGDTSADNRGGVLYNNATDDMHFATEITDGSGIALTIDNQQFVGIGTTSPGLKLEVDSGISSDIVKFGNNSGGFVLGKTANLGSMDLAADAAFRFRHGSVESLRLTPTESVFNEGSANVDFRVESNDSTNMFMVDGSSNTVEIGATGGYISSHLAIQNPRDRHHFTMTSSPNSAISATGGAMYAEGVVSISNVSAGTVLSIPHTSQANLWRPTYVELMFVTGEYNKTSGKAGYAKVQYSMLTYLANLSTMDVGGNVASVTTSGMNLLINFTSGYSGGLNNHEGVQMHYKIMSRTPDYFQAWNATLN